jgi:hypothetical protein
MFSKKAQHGSLLYPTIFNCLPQDNPHIWLWFPCIPNGDRPLLIQDTDPKKKDPKAVAYIALKKYDTFFQIIPPNTQQKKCDLM